LKIITNSIGILNPPTFVLRNLIFKILFKSMEFSKKQNLGLSQSEFECLQDNAPNTTYRILTHRVVGEIQYVLNPVIRQLTPNAADAQDLLAETIEKFWQQLPQLEYRYLNAWVINVCRNLFAYHFRKTKRIELTNDWITNDYGYEEPVELEGSFWDNHAEQNRILTDLLADIEDDSRSIFIQNRLGNESIVTLAQKCDMLPNTLTKRHNRIMQNLRSKAVRYKLLNQ
jgi:RNA polymerase sigma factor (sigma-70 family)